MAKKRDLEEKLWEVYDDLGEVADEKEKSILKLKAIELVMKVRCGGDKVKVGDENHPSDDALENARNASNGTVSRR